MADRVRGTDWSHTPLGPIASWPVSLRVAVGVCLNSRFPMFVWWGPELINIYNDAYVPMLGKRHPAALGRPARASWSDIWDVVGPQADAVMTRGEATWNERVRLDMERHGYLEETYFTWSYSPIPDVHGGVGGLFCAVTEDTPRVFAERQRDRLAQAVRAGEERYRNFVRLSSEGIWRFELDEPIPVDLPPDAQVARMFRDGYLAECNDAMARMYAFASASDIEGRRLHQFQDPADPRNVAFLHAFIAGGYRLDDAESFEPDRHGAPRIFLNSLVGFVEDGRLVRAWGTQRDVTEQRRAEERAVTILESITDAFFAVDQDWRFTYVNAQAERVLEQGPGELIGRVLWEAFPGLLKSEFEAAYRRAAAERTALSVTARYADHDRWYEVHAYPAPDGGISVYVRDVSDRQRSEAARQALLQAERAARAEAERVGQMKDEFLATLSHELRTPLNAILGWAQILQKGDAPTNPSDVRDGLAVIERNARAQRQIIEDLLDMSRIVSGRVRLDVTRVDLGSVIAAAVDTVRPAADAKSVRVASVLDPLAGPVSGDADRLQQVFWNLLSNAVKFTPRGGRVQVVLERVNSHLEVAISDSGEGIAPEFLPHVFDRFRQADASTTRRHGGLGLGLAIVRQLVELHGGVVRAKSLGVGQGATFVVSIPLMPVRSDPGTNDAATTAGAEKPGAAAPPDTCLQLTGVRVLVVDDEHDSRAMIERVLTDCYAVVATAASAAEAIDRLAGDRFDVLVSDIGMPGEDGYDLLRRVRALGPDRGGAIPAVALTAYARTEDRMKAVLAGFQLHMAKPVEPAELITMVASLAGRVGSAQELR
jgi:PAS domain S-box-containing protein